MRPDTDDYREIFLQGLSLIDTRAPVEFAKGAFPTAHNLPLMSDEERELVGIRYKEAGQASAIELGNELVQGSLKNDRVQSWCDFAAEHPEGYIYCFRGGLRSQTSQRWMREVGCEYPLVRGGYKAMRRFLIEEMERGLTRAELTLVAGKTGTGKTRVIEALDRAIDLEGLANHRGSTFGHMPDPQPAQIDFENALSIELLRLMAQDDARVILEDEGRLIGRTSLPESLRDKMQHSPLLVVEEPLQSRVQVILEDYVHDLGARYRQAAGQEEGKLLHRQQLVDGLGRIKKRLGGELHAQIEGQMQLAFEQEPSAVDDDLHRQWIEYLLVQYYDPMYDYQMGKREGAILARGSRAEITALARNRGSSIE
jgi:tRNA 2-selenouridine synthase